MALPTWLSDGLAVAGAASDLFGSSGGAPMWQRRLAERQAALQDEALHYGIRWRVNDAQEAGVHPLFGLGAQISSPSPVSVMAESGAARNRFGEAATRIAALEANAALIEKDQAMADYYRALAAKERQRPVVASATLGDEPVKINPVDPLRHVDWVKLEADPRMAASSLDPGVTAAPDHPAMRQFVFSGGFKMLMPAASGGGMPEDVDIGMWPFILGANIQKYGARWIVDAINYATGASPAETRAQDEAVMRIIRRFLGSKSNLRSMEGLTDGFSSP